MEHRRGEWLDLVSRHHKEWLKIAKIYGCGDFSEDVVQDMYLKLHKYANAEKVLRNGKVSKGYVFFVLKTVALDYHKKKKHFVDVGGVLILPNDISNIEEKQAFDKLCAMIDTEANKWHWYDEQLFQIYKNNKTSVRKIAKNTDISWVSIFNTIKNCKGKIKERFYEDYEDYINGDYDRI